MQDTNRRWYPNISSLHEEHHPKATTPEQRNDPVYRAERRRRIEVSIIAARQSNRRIAIAVPRFDIDMQDIAIKHHVFLWDRIFHDDTIEKHCGDVFFYHIKDPNRSIQECGNPICCIRDEQIEYKQCGRCKGVIYCSQVCQKAHWIAQHRSECTPKSD